MYSCFPLLTRVSKKGIFIGIAKRVKLELMIASPLSSEAMFLSSALRSCAALSISACLSGFISIPSIILVFMFASIVLGMRLGSWVIAVSPILNFLPSLAIVENMFWPFSSTSFPSTLGASSRIIDIAGFLLSVSKL